MLSFADSYGPKTMSMQHIAIYYLRASYIPFRNSPISERIKNRNVRLGLSYISEPSMCTQEENKRSASVKIIDTFFEISTTKIRFRMT